ncbi:hypothetical protein ABZP36_019248, partial [Zizania latifolia]
TNFQEYRAEEHLNPQPENNGVATVVQGEEEHHPPSSVLDWSVFDELSNAHEDEVLEQLETTRLAVDEKDKPTMEACSNLLQTGIRQSRYLLKKNYFISVSANEVKTTSPISSLTDEQWLELVKKWSSAKGKEDTGL